MATAVHALDVAAETAARKREQTVDRGM